MNSHMRILIGCLVLTIVCSCVSPKELVIFNPLDPESLSPEQIANAADLTAQPEDLLRITVSSLDPEAAIPFNLDTEGGQQNQNNGTGGILQLELMTGYFVDREGYIDFPVLGSLYVEGLTLTEIKRLIVDKLSVDYLKSPVVNIRFLNFKVTVLGEVNQPGLVRLSNKRVTLLDALGIVGDLTPYANRTNILVSREAQGARTYVRLDLQNENIFSSPYFYLQQNDVIYVEPIDAKVATVADPAGRIIQYASAALSLVSLIVAFSR